MKPKAWYRPDIDGLRALAIIPVVLFHAEIAGFSGGFVGVDIFFVISGFLITSIIYRELKRGHFSLLTFWERRVRRIVPALFVVVATTLIAGYFIMLFPVDYIDLGQSALAQAVFLANIFFMRKNGYFTEPAETMPLLHTWSLSVEEQFYLGFPLLMLLLWRFGRRALLFVLLLLGLASLAYSHYLLTNPGVGFSFPLLPNVWGGALNQNAAFYLILTRAFELIIGALLALVALTISRRTIREVAALLGLGLIVYAITTYTNETPFPGLAALIPTLGTALIIVANTGRQTWVGSLLAFPVFVWIGLISYSLYLWHWPVFVLAKYYLGRFTLEPAEISLLIALSFLLSYLTYRFVETPFRTKRLLPRRRTLLLSGVSALFLLTLTGYGIYRADGLPERAPSAARAIAAATVDFGERRSECFVNSFSTSDEPCLLGVQDPAAVDFVLWGDSHAGALLPMIDAEASEAGRTGASFIVEGCPPLPGTITPNRLEKCERVKDLAFEYISTHEIPQVLLVARWSAVTELSYPTVELPKALRDAPASRQTAFELSETLRRMARELAASGTTLTVVLQVPKQTSFDVREMFTAAAKAPDAVVFDTISYADYRANQALENGVFEALAREGVIELIEPAELLCEPAGTCTMLHDNTLLYQDADHLNRTGAFYLSPLFANLFDSLKN